MSKVNHGKRLYKGMALEVAVRNPERYGSILSTFSKYEGKVLDDECIKDMYAELYFDKAITASDLTEEIINSKQKLRKYVENKSHNNEWGFPTGYQAAFVRYLKTLSEFGFIYSQYDEEFKISDVGKAVLNGTLNLSDAFALQAIRFNRKSPYRRVLNDFNYFIFIINSIIELNKNNKTLSYPQFLYSLFSDDGDVGSLIDTLSKEKIGDDKNKAYNLVVKNYNKIDAEHDKVSKQDTAFRDYGNTVFRVLQLTGYITVEYSGVMQLSINNNRLSLYRKLLDLNFCLSEDAKDDEKLYFSETGYINKKIISVINSCIKEENLSTLDYNLKIPRIISSYSLNREYLKNYLLDIVNDKEDRKEFWFIQTPVKFELLLTLYLYTCYGDNFTYRPNYKCDDAGIPYCHAPGNMGDIEIYNNSLYWLIEATLIRNKMQQANNETVNLFRHIEKENNREKYLTLVAPYIHEDTQLMIKVASLITLLENDNMTLYSKALNVEEFVLLGDSKENLVDTKKYTLDFINYVKKEIEKKDVA